MNEIRIRLDKGLYRYLKFLEKMRLVDSKEEAIIEAITIYKKLNMQDWLPYVYRSGQERILLINQGMFNDIIISMSETKLYEIARISALKRSVLKQMDPELDLCDPEDWDVILNELQNLGWGKFTRKNDEIMVEFLGVPINFVKGYLETMFHVVFKVMKPNIPDVFILIVDKDARKVWL